MPLFLQFSYGISKHNIVQKFQLNELETCLLVFCMMITYGPNDEVNDPSGVHWGRYFGYAHIAHKLQFLKLRGLLSCFLWISTKGSHWHESFHLTATWNTLKNIGKNSNLVFFCWRALLHLRDGAEWSTFGVFNKTNAQTIASLVFVVYSV